MRTGTDKGTAQPKWDTTAIFYRTRPEKPIVVEVGWSNFVYIELCQSGGGLVELGLHLTRSKWSWAGRIGFTLNYVKVEVRLSNWV